VKLVNLHGLHRVLLVTLHGSPWRVRVRLPAQHPLLASSATYMAPTPLLRHCLDHPGRLRRYESHVSDQPPTRRTCPDCLRATRHHEPFTLRGLGSSPPIQLPTCTRRNNARDAGSLVQPVLYTAYYQVFWQIVYRDCLQIDSQILVVWCVPGLDTNCVPGVLGTWCARFLC